MPNIVTGVVRASFVSVFKKRLNKLSGKEEYSMQLIIPKDSPDVKRLKDAATEAAVEEWGAKASQMKLKSPLRDGDTERSDDPVLKGMHFINCKTDYAPGIIDKDNNEVIDESQFRSGDYCKVSLNTYTYSKGGNQGVAFGLNNIKVMGRGEPLGNRRDARNEDWGEDDGYEVPAEHANNEDIFG